MGEYDLQVRQAIKQSSIAGLLLTLFGGIPSFFFLGALWVSVSTADPPVIAVIGFISLLLLVVWRKGARRRKMAMLADQYLLRLMADPSRSLDNLATTLGSAPHKVQRNMQQMLRLGLFPGAFLNGHQLILPKESAQPPSDTPPQARHAAAGHAGNRTCPGCGAANSQHAKECEYCGSPL